MTFTAVRRTRRWTAPSTGTGRGIPRRLLPAALALLPAFLLGCEESDVVPPEGARLELSADPATVVNVGSPEVTLLAFVTNSLGVSLPDQTVRFNTTDGELDPTSLTPLMTDSNGIARSVLSWPAGPRTTTVNAFSGSATDSFTINVLPGDLQDILINSNDTTVNACNDVLVFTATAVDTNSNPVQGLRINFALRAANGTSPASLGHTFNPAQGVTDPDGDLTTQLSFDQNQCNDKCSQSSMNFDATFCTVSVVAFDQSMLFESTPLPIQFQVP
ncbi:MAG: hypothetical protein HY509_03840 [Acidobacteria bacterium]|nr:hypothetical protein [Acidobacteriota bacterium]